MRTKMIVAAAVALSLLGGAPLCAKANEDKKEAKAAKPKKEPKICKMMATSGTRFDNGRVCKTAADWEKAKGHTLTGASVKSSVGDASDEHK